MIPNPFEGKLFVFEGIDGCGKTVQLKIAQEWIRKIRATPGRCHLVKPEKEPGKDRFWGQTIYKELSKPNGLHTTNLLGFQSWYACDSREHMRKGTLRTLEVGGIVLMDRYRHSMVFGVPKLDSLGAREMEIKRLLSLNLAILGEYFILPDAAFIFDVSIPTALYRLQKKFEENGTGMFDEYEQTDKLELVRSNYQLFARIYPNCHLIDAEGSPEEVSKKVKEIIEPIMAPITYTP